MSASSLPSDSCDSPMHVDDSRYPVAPSVEWLDRWLPDGEIRRRVLADNPARLYDF